MHQLIGKGDNLKQHIWNIDDFMEVVTHENIMQLGAAHGMLEDLPEIATNMKRKLPEAALCILEDLRDDGGGGSAGGFRSSKPDSCEASSSAFHCTMLRP